MSKLLIDDLKILIARKQIIVVIGSGVSLGATNRDLLASWPGLIESGVDRCTEVLSDLPARWAERQKEAIHSGDMDDLLSAAEQVSSKLKAPSGGEFRRWLGDTVGHLKAQDKSVIEALHQLGAVIATTNYDDLLELPDVPAVTWRDGARVEQVLKGDEKGILHLHGHWRDPESIVLGNRSYEDVKRDEHAQTILKAMRTVSSLLFVGCGDGLVDPNIGNLLEWSGEVFAGSVYRQYVLAVEAKRAELQAQHPPQERIFVLNYGPNHSDLAPFLRTLVPSSLPNPPLPLHDFHRERETRPALPQCVERWVAGNASPDDLRQIRQAILTGLVAVVPGNDTIHIGRDVTSSAVISGIGNHITVQISDTEYVAVTEQLFPSPIGAVPPLASLVFLGRDSILTDIKVGLGAIGARNYAGRMLVHGLPGVGKTTLVSVLARDVDLLDRYSDGVLWAALEQTPDLHAILGNWGKVLGTDSVRNAPTIDQASTRLAYQLAKKRTLMIIDDVWDAGHASPLINACGPECALLVTTRLPSVAHLLKPNMHITCQLPVLTPSVALDLLRVIAPAAVDEDTDSCAVIAADVEYLPLALHVAGRQMLREMEFGFPISELVKEIREGAILVDKAPADRTIDGMLPTVAALLARSTDLLDDLTRNCFALLGTFAPKPAAFDFDLMQALWQTNEAKRVVRTLADAGLVEYANGKYQLHALLAMHARSLLR